MRINIQDGETFALIARNVELSEAFPERDAEYHLAAAELDKIGRYWAGGGAAPLVYLTKA